jgi:chemotaxis protein methyltransferase CheR
MSRGELEQLELRLLLEAIHQHYGYDFRGYARSSLRRRIWRRVTEEGLDSISGLQERVLHDPMAMERMLLDLSISVTSMFRDPTFFVALREKVVPILKTYPFIRVWNAGCATGEETHSLAIVFREEGLGDRVRMYATDMNDVVLRQASAGVFPLERMQDYTRDYLSGGGTESFSGYYKAIGDQVRFDPSLTDNVVFARHNLVTDARFNDFHLIVCRNVMIYFDAALQDKVHGLLYDSLVRFGVLALGHKESIRFTSHAAQYGELDGEQRIFKRVA